MTIPELRESMAATRLAGGNHIIISMHRKHEPTGARVRLFRGFGPCGEILNVVRVSGSAVRVTARFAIYDVEKTLRYHAHL